MSSSEPDKDVRLAVVIGCGGIGGGVISYAINGTQRIAVAAGISHPVWPVWPTTGKIAVLGLGETN